MAGHVIVDYFLQKKNDVWYTQRNPGSNDGGVHLDAFDEPGAERLLMEFRPDVVINAVGLLNEAAARRQREAIFVNSYFPHLLALYGQKLGFRFVHISTDCVFSGEAGNYKETDAPDGRTVYAVTKYLGEITDPAHVTIRTSIIGPELKETGIGLFNWFMQQKGEIRGYRQVYWSGVTTLELAKAIEWVVKHPIGGLVHLTSPQKISKYSLLLEMKEAFHKDDVNIAPYDQYKSDKSLVNTRSDFTYQVGSYPHMLQELKAWMDRNGREYPAFISRYKG
jgi:dTDP-4-dehydrorhamnose reductase